MQWRGRRQSENIEDRRGMPMAGGGMKLGGGIGTLVIILIAAYFFGIDPSFLLNTGAPGGGGAGVSVPAGPRSPGEEEAAQFVSVVLADTEDVWNAVFAELGRQYEEPQLVLFTGQVRSACGAASAAVGPFYCPADRKAYLDLGFFDELNRRFEAPGDFAQAYVIAHEIGHHVQNLLGTSEQVHRAQQSMSKEDANELSVRLELQADFLAGVWAHHAQRMRQILESGDVEEALNAATAIGDDTLQKQAQGYVVPESFTHGSAEQRARWFRKGLETGDIKQGDTFAARDL